MPSSSAALNNLAQDSVWLDKHRYDDAESQYVQSKTKANTRPSPGKSSLSDEIARARQQIKKTLQSPDGVAAQTEGGSQGFEQLAAENKKLRKLTEDLTARIAKLETRVASLEKGGAAPAQPKQRTTSKSSTGTPASAKKAEASNDDDDVDLFGSDEEDEDQEKLKQDRVKAYQEKKSKKPALIAKSNIILDVKPWDDETDMKEMEKQVRGITMDGLIWGASKLAPLAYGIHKLQISCVVEDEKVSVDELQEKIQENEDLVQSVDIAAFNKV